MVDFYRYWPNPCDLHWRINFETTSCLEPVIELHTNRCKINSWNYFFFSLHFLVYWCSHACTIIEKFYLYAWISKILCLLFSVFYGFSQGFHLTRYLLLPVLIAWLLFIILALFLDLVRSMTLQIVLKI